MEAGVHERVFQRCALPAGDFYHLHFIVGFFFSEGIALCINRCVHLKIQGLLNCHYESIKSF